MKVLILCNDFPPLNSIGGQRPYSWLRYLPEHGVAVTVVTKNWRPGTPRATGEPTIAADAVDAELGGTVYRVPHRPILYERFVSALGPDTLAPIRRALAMLEGMAGFPFLCFDKHANIYRRARLLLARERFDALLTTAEPFVLFGHGWRLKREFGIPWVADFRDAWYTNHVRASDRRRAMRVMRAYEWLFERTYLAQADLITSVHPRLSAEFGALHRRPVATIYNGFWEYAPSVPESAWAPPGTLVLTHAGTLTPGQEVEVLLQAVAELDEEGRLREGELRLQFLGLEHSRDQAKRVASYSQRSRKYLLTTERVSQAEARAACAASDILVSIGDRKYSALWAKTFDYVAARRPIVLIPDDGGAVRDFLRETGAGVALPDVPSVKGFLLERLIDKRSHGKIPAPVVNRSLTDQYTRACQAAKLAELLKGVCNTDYTTDSPSAAEGRNRAVPPPHIG